MSQLVKQREGSRPRLVLIVEQDRRYLTRFRRRETPHLANGNGSLLHDEDPEVLYRSTPGSKGRIGVLRPLNLCFAGDSEQSRVSDSTGPRCDSSGPRIHNPGRESGAGSLAEMAALVRRPLKRKPRTRGRSGDSPEASWLGP